MPERFLVYRLSPETQACMVLTEITTASTETPPCAVQPLIVYRKPHLPWVHGDASLEQRVVDVGDERADVHQVELLSALTRAGLHVRDVPLQAVRPVRFSRLVERVASAFGIEREEWED